MAGESVLVVDDDPENLKFARILLESEDFDVRTAVDAESALELLALGTWLPRVILMDVRLPQMDGLDLTRRLKSDPVYARIAIIAVSACAMKGDDAKAMAAGCDAYVTKPIFVDELLAMIVRILA